MWAWNGLMAFQLILMWEFDLIYEQIELQAWSQLIKLVSQGTTVLAKIC